MYSFEPLEDYFQRINKEWKWLSQEDIDHIHDLWMDSNELPDEQAVIQLVEKMLKEKNNL